MKTQRFKTPFAETIFRQKYAQGPNDTWDNLCDRLINDVCGDRSLCAKPNTSPLMSTDEQKQLAQYMKEMKVIFAGRYLYYAGRPISFFNNCFALRAEEDTREEWGNIVKRASDCLMSGGGITINYSRLRPSGRALARTGGVSSGPLPLMSSVNEIGRNVQQGGSRRSAIGAILNWQHEDIETFLTAKDWSETIKKLKAEDFNFPAPFDMTNMSINWDTDFISKITRGNSSDAAIMYDCNGDCIIQKQNIPDLWYKSVLKMCQTGEPGHTYDFWENENDNLRNACMEFTSEDDSDVCNLGSINFGNIRSIEELTSVVNLASKFLVCGSIRGDLPYDKVRLVRERNRKIGLGLMGVHEWLLQRSLPYEVNDELKSWLQVWKDESERSANEWSDRFFINRPKKYRAVAPAGTIGILASTTGGIEPLFAVAYKRRYLEGGTKWKYQYVVDSTAQHLIDAYGINPDEIETSSSLAADPERRIRFQYEIQKYVDMAISSTINLPEWGSTLNNESTATRLADALLRYCHGLRGITVYPNGSRGGQPLTSVSYEEAKKHHGVVYAEENTCSGGICSV